MQQKTRVKPETSGQISASAAEVYEEIFLPALCQPWAGRSAEAADLPKGGALLDVACGTGVVAREVARRVEGDARLVGVDRNAGMLAVARRAAPNIEWRLARAEELPFADGEFDAVTCQFGLMFFEDRVRALAEMARVLKPGGTMVVAVWDRIQNAPAYAVLADLIRRRIGQGPAQAFEASFSLGERDALEKLFVEAGLAPVRVVTPAGTARFDSWRALVDAEVKGWVLGDQVDDAEYAALLREAEPLLAPYVAADGHVEFSMPAHLATVSRA